MRTQTMFVDVNGQVHLTGYRNYSDLPFDLQNLLAMQGLASVTLYMKDGTQHGYKALEYECEICDQYGHETESCPDLDDELEGYELDGSGQWIRSGPVEIDLGLNNPRSPDDAR